MSKPGDMASDAADEAIEEALSDHHLDEVAEMIERWHAGNMSPETPISESLRGRITDRSRFIRVDRDQDR